MAEALGVAVVGMGFWGTVLAEAVQRAPSLRLAACVTRRAEKAAEVAECWKVPALPDLEAALARPEVEAVILATGNPEHAPGILKAAAAGRHAFVEKPVTTTLEEARQVAEAVGRAGVVVAVGHQFRCTGAVQAARRLIGEGALGQVLLAEANYSLPAKLAPGSWKWSQAACPGGTLVQIGIHHLDTLTYLLGPARVVGARLSRAGGEAPIPTVAAVLLAHERGATSSVVSSYRSPWRYAFHLYGTEANLLCRARPGARVPPRELDRATELLLQRGDQVEAVAFEPVDPLVAELEAFAAAVRGEGQVAAGLAEGAAALDLVWQAVRLAGAGDA